MLQACFWRILVTLKVQMAFCFLLLAFFFKFSYDESVWNGKAIQNS